MLQLSGLARSTFYYYLKHLNTDKYKCEKQEIQEIYNTNKGRYGYGESFKTGLFVATFTDCAQKKQLKAYSVSRFAALLRFAATCQRRIVKRNSGLVRSLGFQYNGKHL